MSLSKTQSQPDPELLTKLLKEVSRSFYLTLRVLPGSIRPQIGLAYLLARTTDTIADTGLIPVERRLEVLNSFRQQVDNASSGNDFSVELGDLAEQQSSPAERVLLSRAMAALNLLSAFPARDRELIQQVIQTITSGQELDLLRFGSSSRDRLQALANAEELDDYTYRVAGCVGEFWTKMCLIHLFPSADINEGTLLSDGVAFGKGLQLVNILRDLPVDLRQGRCYLPQTELRAANLSPQELLDPSAEPVFRPVYDRWLMRARGYLTRGWRYTNTLPRSHVRLRLACAWPVLIGLGTLDRLAAQHVLDPARRIKVSRSEVKKIIFRSVLALPFSGAWKALPGRSLAP